MGGSHARKSKLYGATPFPTKEDFSREKEKFKNVFANLKIEKSKTNFLEIRFLPQRIVVFKIYYLSLHRFHFRIRIKLNFVSRCRCEAMAVFLYTCVCARVRE